jgi:hypothetical protein
MQIKLQEEVLVPLHTLLYHGLGVEAGGQPVLVLNDLGLVLTNAFTLSQLRLDAPQEPQSLLIGTLDLSTHSIQSLLVLLL